MIRRATYDESRDDGGPDVDRFLRLLRTAPIPPKETPDSIGSRIEGIYVDEDRDTAAEIIIVHEPPARGLLHNPPIPRGVDMAATKQVAIISFLPRADWTGDNMADLMPLMAFACQDILDRFPEAGPWLLYGDFQPDITDERVEVRKRTSEDIAKAWTERGRPGAITFGVGPTPIYTRGYSTVGFIARAWQVPGGA